MTRSPGSRVSIRNINRTGNAIVHKTRDGWLKVDPAPYRAQALGIPFVLKNTSAVMSATREDVPRQGCWAERSTEKQ